MLLRGAGRVAARLQPWSACETMSIGCSQQPSPRPKVEGNTIATDSLRRPSHHISRYSTNSSGSARQSPKTETSSRPSIERALPRPRHRSSRPSRKLIALAIILTASGAIWYLSTPDALPTDRVFNTERFTPFDLVARETVSPTSFILTLRPSPATFSSLSLEDIAAQLAEPWTHHDLWAVEVKQPQLQIARDYTPLPPSADGSDAGTLRLWIRAVDGGETSTYLSRLVVGSRVELRGPRGSFDLTSRLGPSHASPAPPSSPKPSRRQKWEKAQHREVLLLAGGTGIATALQAAHALLNVPDDGAPLQTRVRILWAVRSQSDVQQLTPPATATTPAPPSRPPPLARVQTWWSFLTGSPRDDNVQTEITPSFASPTDLTRQILDLKARHGDRLTAHFVVDDEGTYISAANVLDALGGPVAPRGDQAPPADAQCQFHAQALHARMTDGAPNAGRKDLFRRHVDCRCPAGARPGKDLVLVTGPDGFIAAYAGAKQWLSGGQVQGPIGGVLGELERRHPGLLKDRLVLKL